MRVITLCADYGHLDKAETMVKSILYNNQYVKIYLLNCDIPQEWFVNINQYVNQTDSEVIDAKFDHGVLNDSQGSRLGINEMGFARFLIPELVLEDGVLYLDSDLIVDDAIDDLFTIPLNGKETLRVDDIFDSDDQRDATTNCLINSGVLVLDNATLKKNNINRDLIKMSRKNYVNGDQQIINEYFKGKIGLFPRKYNHQVDATYFAYSRNDQRMINLLSSVKDPETIHYVMKEKPSDFCYLGIVREKWWFYRNLELSKLIQKSMIFDSMKIGAPKFATEALIFTYSVDIQNPESLIRALPEIYFNIATYTEVATGLLDLMKYPNVTVYPAIIYARVEELIKKCELYLDIDYYQKDENVLRQVEDKGTPILSFEDTANKDSKYSNYKVFGNDQVDRMVQGIKNLEE